MSSLPLCSVVFIILTLIYECRLNYPQNKTFATTTVNKTSRIAITLASCDSSKDSRFSESLNLVKSVLMFTKTPVHFVIFTEKELQPRYNYILSKWREVTDGQLSFELHLIYFPEPVGYWKNLFAKCAAQRLFLPKLLTHLDAVIYVDTDTLFLGPADELWGFFSKFTYLQIFAMVMHQENLKIAWYPRVANIPYYGNSGVNSGVILMNLTRLRQYGFVDLVMLTMRLWKDRLKLGDQDIINIILHHEEDLLLELSCRYNYRTDQCVDGDTCADATHRGVFLLHGSRKVFHNYEQPAFTAVYRAVENYDVGTDPLKTFLPILKKYLFEAPKSICGNKDAFLKVPNATLMAIPIMNCVHYCPGCSQCKKIHLFSIDIDYRDCPITCPQTEQ